MTMFQYAYYNALMVHTEENLQTAVDVCSYAYNALRLTLNTRKTLVHFQPSPDNKHGRQQPEIPLESK